MTDAFGIATAATYFAVSAVCMLVFFRQRKASPGISSGFLVMCFSFMSIGISGLLLPAGASISTAGVSAMHAMLWGIVFALVVSRISHIRKIRYFTYLMIASIIIALPIAGPQLGFMASFLGYYIAMMAFFVLFMFSSRPVKWAGLYGQIGVLAMIFLTALGRDPLDLAWAVPNTLIAIALSRFYGFGLQSGSFTGPEKPGIPEEHGDVRERKPFAYLMAYIILLNFAVIVAGIVLHELGHLAAGMLFNCKGGEVVMIDLLNPAANPGPYTRMSCPAPVSGNMAAFLGVSGFMFAIPFALAFLILKRFPEKNLAYVIIGFSLGLASLDLLLVLAHYAVIYASLAAGVLVMCMGESFLLDDYVSYARGRDKAKEMAKNVKC